MHKNEKQQNGDSNGGVAGMFKGLGDLIERLGELAEQGEELHHSGSTDSDKPGKKPLRGVYGFSVKFGGGQNGLKVEPFGHTRAAAQRGDETTAPRDKAAEVHEVREPMVDMFDESDGVYIVAEMPGVAAKHVQLDLKDDILVIKAECGDKKYKKELLLPRAYSRDAATVVGNNGIVEIWLR